MNKIHFAANADTNYVYHMLSAARCGYDNAYGERYREHYPMEELSVFRQYEDELTVRGSTWFFSGQQKIARLCEAMEKEGIRGAPALYRAVRAAKIPE